MATEWFYAHTLKLEVDLMSHVRRVGNSYTHAGNDEVVSLRAEDYVKLKVEEALREALEVFRDVMGEHDITVQLHHDSFSRSFTTDLLHGPQVTT